MRRTKIVATIGPSSSDEDVLRRMIEAGMDMARLNFSHGTHAGHERNFRRIRKLSAKTGKPLGILADLQGPKMRIGELAGETLDLKKGNPLTITTRKIKGTDGIVSSTYKRLHEDARKNDRILLDDGSIELKVIKVESREVHCRIMQGGELRAHKGINLPGVKVSESSLTRKDRADVRFAVKLGVDYLAMSFVRHPKDIVRLKRLLMTLNADIPVIAKIEKPEALENIEEIIEEADGIMVARGDLGVEMPAEKVPQIQKDVIALCIRAGKPLITATQMLESMVQNPRPTRAEASDVVNAIYDGTGAVMLSQETALGSYPVKAVRMMARIAREADAYVTDNLMEERKKVFRRSGTISSFENAIGDATETAARHLPTRFIVCFTSSGFTAQKVSSYRPSVPIIGATQNPGMLPRMSLYWGVQPIRVKQAKTIDSMIANIEQELLKRRMVRKGENIIITAGYPLGVAGTTNMMQLVRVGKHDSSGHNRPRRGKRN